MNRIQINQNGKAEKYQNNTFNYATNFNPLGPKQEELKSIYKLNKIKDNLELIICKRKKSKHIPLLMLIDFILFLLKLDTMI